MKHQKQVFNHVATTIKAFYTLLYFNKSVCLVFLSLLWTLVAYSCIWSIFVLHHCQIQVAFRPCFFFCHVYLVATIILHTRQSCWQSNFSSLASLISSCNPRVHSLPFNHIIYLLERAIVCLIADTQTIPQCYFLVILSFLWRDICFSLTSFIASRSRWLKNMTNYTNSFIL